MGDAPFEVEVAGQNVSYRGNVGANLSEAQKLMLPIDFFFLISNEESMWGNFFPNGLSKLTIKKGILLNFL